VAGDHVAIVDEDCPELDDNEEADVQVLLHGADEDKDTAREVRGGLVDRGSVYSLVRQRLHVAVERVKGQGSPRGGHFCSLSAHVCGVVWCGVGEMR
jgi:hypothetical protein